MAVGVGAVVADDYGGSGVDFGFDFDSGSVDGLVGGAIVACDLQLFPEISI